MTNAYVTNDLACQRSSADLARIWGVRLVKQSYRDPPPNGQFERVFYDLDSAPVDRRLSLMSQLTQRPLQKPIAVHSYNVTEPEEAALEANGVNVYRRLDSDSFTSFFLPDGQRGAATAIRMRRDRGGPQKPSRVAIGAICQDNVLRYRQRNGQSKHDIVSRHEAVGGKAANVMRGHRLLAPDRQVAVIAAVGDDNEGHWLQQMLSEQGIETPLPPVAHMRTSVSYVINEHNALDSQILCDSGARSATIPLDLIQQTVADAELLCLAHPGVNQQIPDFLQIAHRYQVPVCFGLGRTQFNGLGYRGLSDVLVQPIFLLICNRAEAMQLTMTDNIQKQLGALSFQDRVRIVVITDGADGIHARMDGVPYYVPAYTDARRTVVDDCGAGDAAEAAIEDALLRGYPLDLALVAGARQGFEACTGAGATVRLLNCHQMQAFLSQASPAAVG